MPRQNSNTLSVGDLPGSKVVKRFKKVKPSGAINVMRPVLIIYLG
jgi:hypothetical protein